MLQPAATHPPLPFRFCTPLPTPLHTPFGQFSQLHTPPPCIYIPWPECAFKPQVPSGLIWVPRVYLPLHAGRLTLHPTAPPRLHCVPFVTFPTQFCGTPPTPVAPIAYQTLPLFVYTACHGTHLHHTAVTPAHYVYTTQRAHYIYTPPPTHLIHFAVLTFPAFPPRFHCARAQRNAVPITSRRACFCGALRLALHPPLPTTCQFASRLHARCATFPAFPTFILCIYS